MYLAYTYLIRNKITNQFYYGSRYGNIKLKRTPKEDLWIKYFTSSKEIKKQITIYGVDSFEISFLLEDNDYDKCYMLEQTLISHNIDNELCLNKKCHPTGKWSTAGTHHSDKSKIKMSLSKKGKPQSPESNIKRSISSKGRLAHNKGKTTSDETKAKLSLALSGENNPNYGKPKSQETKTKMSFANLGKVTPPEVRIKQCISNKGRAKSQETKDKMKASALARWAKIKDISG